MKQHLSNEQIDKFLSRTLPPSELLQVDDHLAACEMCMQRVTRLNQRAVLKVQDQMFGSNVDDDHLSYDLMSRFVDETLDGPELELVKLHRETCAECSHELDGLNNLRAALIAGSAMQSRQPNVLTAWAKRIFGSPFFKIAVPAGFILLVGLFFWYIRTERPANVADVAQPSTLPTPIMNPANPQLANDVNSPPPQKIVVSLNDGGGRVQLDDTGRIAGLPNHDFDQKIRTVLKNQTVDIPQDVSELRSANGVLMGSSENGIPFKLVGPVAKVVETRRPTFTWQPLKDADGYKAGIYDENFDQVAISPQLRSTKWTPDIELKRGRIYQWQVTAIRNSEEVKSPVRPAPAAKFKIVDEASIAALQNARRTAANSHLVLGIAYANAGLIDEAERELQLLLKNNPNSEIAKKLLAKVRAYR